MFYYQKKGIPSENPFLFRKEFNVFIVYVCASGLSLTEIFGLKLIPEALELQYISSRAATTCGSKA